MKVCTLETGRPDDALIDAFGDYPAMVERHLRPHLDGARFCVTSLVAGEPLPVPQAFDAYVIMGSRHGVYDDLPWIAPLKRFIRQVADLRIPLVGICFGHQIMAEALGGRAERAQAGWIVGAGTYRVAASGVTLSSLAFHRDQVVVQPPDSEVVLSSAACPIAGLLYTRFPGMSVQPHPEFDTPYIRKLLEHTRANPIDPEITDAALGGIDTPVDRQRFFRTLALVLAKHSDARTIAASLSGAGTGSD